jgi:hypothetical protein
VEEVEEVEEVEKVKVFKFSGWQEVQQADSRSIELF